jgi:tetratricopeptide (TPR) repeat protein
MLRSLAVALLLASPLYAAPRATPASETAAHKGEALRKTGKYAEARKLLEEALVREPDALHARLELGRIYRLTGEVDREKKIWNQFFDDYEANSLDKKSARDLTYVALAAQYLESWKDANDTFRDAVDADPKGKDGARANLAWAALFLEKYDAGHAEQSIEEALKILPDDAEAHALYARVKMEQGYDIVGAEKEIALALKKDPRETDALGVRAEIALFDEDYAEALRRCQAVLAINPEDLRARTVAAAARLLSDDRAGFEAERDRVLKTNPRASAFFRDVAEYLVKEHRYEEADTLDEQAIKVNPRDWVALANLGSNLLRLGDDKRGLAELQRAWKGDPFNVRTYNLLNLFEDVIPKGYTLVESKPFRFRVANDEKKILEQYVRPMVEREWKELCKRYGFTPQNPVTLEMYTDPNHYAVRTVGLPGLEALGVTFGRVITAMSPSMGRFNWGMTLWHEVGHVFSIQLSKSRVPRWFTEGLSEWETAHERPEWTRRTHAELYRALKEDQLRSVAELNGAFTHARDIAHMVVAYHQSAEEVAFLIRLRGFDKAVEALKLFAAGKDTRAVIPAVTGLSLEKYDAEFRADLTARLQPYEGTFEVTSTDISDVEGLEQRLKQNPNDLRAKGLYALALVKAHRRDEAKKLIDSVDLTKPTTDRQRREILLAGAQLAMQDKEWSIAKTLFGGLLTIGGDGYDARIGLGKIAVAEKNEAEAMKNFELAKKMDPERAEPYVELGKLWLSTREDDALKELEAAARLDCMDASIPKLLVEKLAKKARWQKLVEVAPLALYTDPFDAKVHLHLARAHAELGHNAEALREVDAGEACKPDEKTARELTAVEQRAGRI